MHGNENSRADMEAVRKVKIWQLLNTALLINHVTDVLILEDLEDYWEEGERKISTAAATGVQQA